ncbi:MAG: site-2 protease family protein [Candidatus Kerfeldbacteria bacterium]|nr:site-2 protease family protein [Candidatus Kerfeldbacteria bacterium]
MFSIQTLFSDPLRFVVGFLALAVSIGIHEFAHVLAADLQGDSTGRSLGRLTLNPLRHLDPLGTIAILIAGIGWGKPAPFNPYNLRFRRWGPALVAVAGPIANIVMLILAGYALVILQASLGNDNLLRLFLHTLVILNAALAVFNLIPVHPLDGSHLLRALLTPVNPLVQWVEQYGVYLLLGILFFGGAILNLYIVTGIRWLLTAVGLSGLFL